VRRQILGNLAQARPQIVVLKDRDAVGLLGQDLEIRNVLAHHAGVDAEAARPDGVEGDVRLAREAKELAETLIEFDPQQPHPFGLKAHPIRLAVPGPHRDLAVLCHADRRRFAADRVGVAKAVGRRRQRIGKKDDVLALLPKVAEHGDEPLEVRINLVEALQRDDPLAVRERHLQIHFPRHRPQAVGEPPGPVLGELFVDALGQLAEKQILRRLGRRQHPEEVLRSQHPVEQLPEWQTEPVGPGDVDVERIQVQHEDAVARVLRELEPVTL
jgi:hypothetical protein